MTALKSTPLSPAYRSTALDDVPEVDNLLDRLGLGPLERATVRSVMGRNHNWIGTTASGAEVFIKQLTGHDAFARLHRTRQAADAAGQTVEMPTILGIDDTTGLVVSGFLPDARTARDLNLEDALDPATCERAGALLARFHQIPVQGFDTQPHPLPPTGALQAVRMEYFVQASSAELAMWRLLQKDTALVDGLEQMRAFDSYLTAGQIEGATPTPIHGDMRLDQFLLADNTIYLTDFEECRVGDPARDVGGILGEWLFFAACSIPTTLAGALPVGGAANHAQIVATGVSEIEARRPLMKAFVEGYRAHRPEINSDLGFASRAAAFAGWHLLDRMLASAETSSRLSAVNKAAAGIGRTLLLSPNDFITTLALEA